MADIGKPIRETERPAPVPLPVPERAPVAPPAQPKREPVKPGSTGDRGWLGVGSQASVDRPRIRRVVSFGERPIRVGEALPAARRREIRWIRAQT